MSHSQFHCTGRAYLDMHGLIFETSICYWQDQPGRKRERAKPGGEKRERGGIGGWREGARVGHGAYGSSQEQREPSRADGRNGNASGQTPPTTGVQHPSARARAAEAPAPASNRRTDRASKAGARARPLPRNALHTQHAYHPSRSLSPREWHRESRKRRPHRARSKGRKRFPHGVMAEGEATSDAHPRGTTVPRHHHQRGEPRDGRAGGRRRGAGPGKATRRNPTTPASTRRE